MSLTKTVEIPDFVIGERVGLGPDHNNPGTILEFNGLRARVRFGFHPEEYRNWYGLDELFALPGVKVGDRVGYMVANDPNPGTVTEIVHSRAAVEWDRGISTRLYGADELVVIPPDEADCGCLTMEGPGLKITFSGAGLLVVGEELPIQHIVCRIGRQGQPIPAARPFVHDSQDAATAEAERLAKRQPGDSFAVFQRVASVRAEVVVQRAA